MYRLFSTILFLGLAVTLYGQSPHGDDFKMDCAACHTSDSWEIPMESWKFDAISEVKTSRMTGMFIGTSGFNHNATQFPLEGSHIDTNCKACHSSLVFSDAATECISCHTDMHAQSVGSDCARCHNASTWLVDNIPELHEENSFPLIGAHDNLSCVDCHISEMNLRFGPIGNDCISCHLDDFTNTQSPDHEGLGFSTNCIECHDPLMDGWDTDIINHDFFPLTGGHDIQDCQQCHLTDNYSDISADCVSCHQDDFNNTADPDHEVAQFATDCTMCHTTGPGWQPAEFASHDDEYFPIYSGAHEGVWADCVECHINPANYAEFSCTTCHINPETDDQHNGINGYTYQDNACLACHSTGSADDGFDHNNTNFPLTGAHVGVDCLECHTDGFAGTPTDCNACHTMDFNATVNPNHMELNLPTDCIQCHTTEPNWIPASFDIHNDFYQLNGAHAMIANDCAACHNGDYTNTPNTCVGCHLDDFNSVTEPSHADANFSTDCTQCHSEDSWTPSSFDHNDFYPLNGAHADIANDCNACHNGVYVNTPNTCVACHQDDFDATTDPNHAAANFSTDCTVCHTEDAWTPSNFDHDSQYFPIYSGAHEGEWNDCIDCHTNPNNFAEFSCTNCHENPETDNDHNGVNGYVYQDDACLACHPTGSEDDGFNHNNTNFPLTGAHIGIDCLDCHADGFAGTPTDCNACHTMDFNATVNPNHMELNLPTDCIQCHTTEADWMPASFDIHNDYYQLNGAHAMIANDCAACHNGDYTNTPNTCVGCHLNDFNTVAEPNHVEANFPSDCTQCHSEDSWSPSSFDHNDFYPLNGAHANIANDCNDCHNGDYTNTPNTCVGCHLDNFNSVAEPNHIAANFSTDCTQCHTEDAWEPSSFDHNDFYPLNGAHADIANDCNACHNGVYVNTPNTCIACHQDDYDATIDPNHGMLNFSTDCTVCHTEEAWLPSTFDHDSQYFPIYSGAHEGEWNDCIDCHTNPNNYMEFSCTNCHENPETDNDHTGINGYVYDDNACLACHPTGNADDGFDHNSTNFPLTGAHIGIDCLDCHADGFVGTPTDCNACHMMDYNSSINPNHVELNLPTDCATCHTTDPDWMPASFAIHNDYYPLNGAHAMIANDCAACHNGDYTNTPNTCVGCHLDDFNSVAEPNHIAANFSTDCTQCHTEDAWEPSSFDHNDFYPLNGAHADIANDCNACHNGVYVNTPNTCIACHQDDYDATIDPNHGMLNFSTDCTVCHTEDAWLPSTFDHDSQYFPIYSGAHEGEWNDCIDCHTNPNNYMEFSCTNCHENPETDNDHTGVNGYVYDDNACLACHPTGNADDGFDHNSTNFPLTGAHIGIDCLGCHADGFAGTPTDCNACHMMDYNSSLNPNHVELNLSTDCAACHTTDPDWMPASFAIHNDYYPLNGAHAMIANDCAACHNGDYNNTPNTCVGCHLDDFNNTNNPNHSAAQFPTDCEQCHSETGWTPSTFDHDNMYFPIYSGKHKDEWNQCTECHTIANDYSMFSCIDCHEHNNQADVDDDHNGVSGYVYQSNACYNCHPTGDD